VLHAIVIQEHGSDTEDSGVLIYKKNDCGVLQKQQQRGK